MATPRIALIHATPVSLAPIAASFRRLWPEAETTNLLEDALATDRAKDAALTPAIHDRIGALADYAVRLGADAILFTCSAFGPAIEAANARLALPVLKPNEAMFEEALALGPRIGMISTFAPSVATMQAEFAEEAARLRPGATLTVTLVDHAMAALRAGDAETHNRLVSDAAEVMTGVDAIMLGQFSIANAMEACRAKTAIPVLSSPDAAVRKVRRLLQQQ